MEDLNNVPSSGTYGAAITEVNRNFSLIVNAINSLEYATTKSKGIYNNGFTPSSTTLPNSVDGDWCVVLGTGNTFPARIWTYNGTTWAQGGTWNPDGINLNDYATTTALNTAVANSLAQATARMGYGEATASNNAYSVTITGYTLPADGGVVRVKMPTSATGAATLNITDTGAKTIWYNGAAVSSANTWAAQEIISVFYDGTKYMASNSQGTGLDQVPTNGNTMKAVSSNGVFNELYASTGQGGTETIPSYTLNNGKGVLYDTGELTGNMSAAAYTSFINVSGYNRIVYGNLAFNTAPSTHLGMAFYDANQNFIPNSGRSFAIDPNAPSYVDTEIQVPSNAVYARFCAYATTYLTGFYVKLYSGGGYYNRIGLLEKSKGAYDVSAANNGASYGSLSSALSAIPDYLHVGGMSIKYIDSSSNKYVQYTLTSSAWSTTESDWVLNEFGGVIKVPSINKLAKALVFPSPTSGKWAVLSGRYSVFVPVDGNTEYIIEGNDQQSIQTYYAIIKDTSWTADAVINNYATGENSVHTLPVNTKQRFTTPSDARFVCVMVEYNGTDISPKNIYKVVKFNNGSLYGKKVLCVGDSVTWMKFYTEALQQKTKCILYNRGVSGTTVANYGSLPNAFVERADLTANDEYFSISNNNVIGFPSQADYVFVLGGVNDWARVRRQQSFTLGDITAANNKTTFIGAWKYLLSKLKEKYPMAKIVTMLMYDVYTDAIETTLNHSEVTLTNGSDIAGGYSVISQTTTGQSTAVSFDDLRNAVKDVSKLYGAECLDLREAGFSAFVASDRTNFYNNADGLHVNANGGEYIANYIFGRMF